MEFQAGHRAVDKDKRRSVPHELLSRYNLVEQQAFKRGGGGTHKAWGAPFQQKGASPDKRPPRTGPTPPGGGRRGRGDILPLASLLDP